MDTQPNAPDPAAASFCQRQPTMLVGDTWKAARNGETLPVINPADEAVVAHVPAGRAPDVDDAVAAARRAFDAGVWSRIPASARSQVLWRIGDLIDEHADELANLETLDNGKTLRAARSVDIPSSAEMFRYMAGWCTKLEGATYPISSGTEFLAYSCHEPVGVVGLIVPWNFPLKIAADKVAAALAAGCTVVLKPAEETPLTALRLGELALDAGLPHGVLNIVTGLGPLAGAAIAAHQGVDKVSFTGSASVARSIVGAAMGNLKRLTLELGGKSPTIVLPDADMDAAVPSAAAAIFGNAGQTCVAGSRLFVHEAVYDEVLSGVVDYARSLAVGNGLSPTVDMGPLVSERQLERVLGYLRCGDEVGAHTVTGGRRAARIGYFVEPTVFDCVRDNMAVAREEIFGPVLAVFRFSGVDEVIRRANSTRYGLSAVVWTKDVSVAHTIAAGLRAGTVWVNNYGAGGPAVPFGGYKESGWGRERGRAGIEAFTEVKSVVVRL